MFEVSDTKENVFTHFQWQGLFAISNVFLQNIAVGQLLLVDKIARSCYFSKNGDLSETDTNGSKSFIEVQLQDRIILSYAISLQCSAHNWHKSELLTVLPKGCSTLSWERKNCHRRREWYKDVSAIRNRTSCVEGWRKEELCLIGKRTRNKTAQFKAHIHATDCSKTNSRKQGWNLDFIQCWCPDQWI